MQQVSRTKTGPCKDKNKSKHKEFHEQNQFHVKKIGVQVSRREKSTCKKFHEQ